jgi:hypothetical protein
MTEPLFVCEMIWTVVWLVEWRTNIDAGTDRRNARLLWLIASVLIAAVFTRYDGWVMALIAWTAIGVVLLRRGKLRTSAFWLATILVIAAPIVWLAYNQIVFGDWLDFARGPYSAKAIELATTPPGSGPPHPGWHNPSVSLIFYVKTFKMDAAAAQWGSVLLAVSILGTAWGWLIARRKAFAWTLLLWLPIPFYAYSVSYGSVPIFLPVWWPHSFYNTRYGLEMLPVLALGIGFAANLFLTGFREFNRRANRVAAALMFAAVIINAALMLHQGPMVYIEGTKNAIARRPYEQLLASALREQLKQHPGAVVLMNSSVYPHVVALSGIPFSQTINESDKEYYKAALESPAQHATIVLAGAGDPIETAVRDHPAGLIEVGHFSARFQPSITFYVSDTLPANAPAGAGQR